VHQPIDNSGESHRGDTSNREKGCAIALVAACRWSGANLADAADVPHLPFVAFWLACAAAGMVDAFCRWNGFVPLGDVRFVFGAGSDVMLGLCTSQTNPLNLNVPPVGE
jgi:hypothetical protein